jgi:hypothetical protein
VTWKFICAARVNFLGKRTKSRSRSAVKASRYAKIFQKYHSESSPRWQKSKIRLFILVGGKGRTPNESEKDERRFFASKKTKVERSSKGEIPTPSS